MHRNEAAFVPPFPGSVAKLLGPRGAFRRLHGEVEGFIAERGGRPIGRVAAIVNRSHLARHGDGTGFFGFFECVDEPEVAGALFRKVAGVVGAAGLGTVRGPYNPSINDECGLLLDRHGEAPVFGTTWAPRHHRRLVEGAGFRRVWSLHTFDLPMHRLETPPRVVRIVERMKRKSSLRVRPINMRALGDDLGVVRDVYNGTLERNRGFVPITLDDLMESAGELRAVANPELLLIGESGGRPAGVALTLPDINQHLWRARRTPLPLRAAHVFWLLKTRPVSRVRQTVLGVLPEFRDRGLNAWLTHEQFVVAKRSHRDAVLGWVEDSNEEVIEHCRLFGAGPGCEWGIFECGTDSLGSDKNGVCG